jgi:hypothetical protein
LANGDYDARLKLGPNIKDWPEIAPLGDNLLVEGGLLYHRARYHHGRAHPLG